MDTLWIKEQELPIAAEYLKRGHVVAFPTETVYGLGADATSSQAVKRIYTAKGRPSDNPLIVHIANRLQLEQFVASIPPHAQQLMDHFWPGPLTIIVNVLPHVLASEVTAGLSTVGVRMPDHPLARRLIELVNCPLAAPSANTSGKPSPTTAQHVKDDLDGRVKAIVDGGETGIGLESTIIDITQTPPVVLRPGGISIEALTQCIGEVSVGIGRVTHNDPPQAPGMKYRHYSPQQPVKVIRNTDHWQSVITKLLKKNEKIGILANERCVAQFCEHATATYSLGEAGDIAQASQRLYRGLRALDQSEATIILVEAYAKVGLGQAYMNRLEKASTD